MEAERHDRIRQVLRVTKGFEAVKSDRARRPLDLEIPLPEVIRKAQARHILFSEFQMVACRRLDQVSRFYFAIAEKDGARSEEHTSELQSLMRTSYAVFCLK